MRSMVYNHWSYVDGNVLVKLCIGKVEEKLLVN